ncbi:hypothetical protein Tco_0647468 [Tanacetum coccineum]
MDVSHCRLHKTILQVASNYLESDISECLSQQLDLGTKGSIWCKTHMEKTLMSPYDVQKEEHYELFFKELLDMFSHSDAVLSAIAKHPVLINQVQEFTLKLLSLTQDSIIRAKSIQAYGPEILQASQPILLSVLKLCKTYLDDMRLKNSRNELDVSTIEGTLRCLVELGVHSANGDENLLTANKITWEGVVTLLQLGKGLL